jgi:PAS domain S-box-containing protein
LAVQKHPGSSGSAPLAAVVCDAAWHVTAWSEGARRLMGHRPEDIVGQPVSDLVDGEAPAVSLLSAEHDDGSPARVRHRDGHAIDVGIRVIALPDGDRRDRRLLLIGPSTGDTGRTTAADGAATDGVAVAAGAPVVGGAAPADEVAAAEEVAAAAETANPGETTVPDEANTPDEATTPDVELAARAFAQLPWVAAVHDLDFRYRMVNEALTRRMGCSEEELIGKEPRDYMPYRSGEVERAMRAAITAGREVTRTIRVKMPSDTREHTWGTHFIPLKDDTGTVRWICSCALDITSEDRVRDHLTLLDEASRTVGSTLDVTRTAEELVRVLVPVIADFATVDLLDSVFGEHEPAPGRPAGTVLLKRVAMESVYEGAPESVLQQGDTEEFPEYTPHARCMATGEPFITPFPSDPGFREWANVNRARMTSVEKYGMHSSMVIPLRARGTTLGVAVFVRHQHPEPFGDDDLLLGQEITARAAVSIDNALRYTRQRDTAVTLQRRLLPQRLPDRAAIDVTGRYLPSDAQTGIGGDWYDVVPLSGARVALVVGDVVGHGIHAAARMGRLRTAVRTLADLELPPDELLTHLDDLVAHPDGSTASDDEEVIRDTGTTCLYAVYDPVSRLCTMARAGHPQPALVRPDGSTELLDVPAGPPLGLGNQPFETREVELEPGSLLVLYTDGLVERRGQDMDLGIARLLQTLAGAEGSLGETSDRILDTLLPESSEDDVALLLARTRALAHSRVATWDFPADPTVVGGARERAMRQLDEWGLEELAFSTEMIVSELVTNGIRHGSGPIRLRLILEDTLICEVTDRSNTYPHLRRARTLDESGRGLFLVSQLSQRWGTRATDTGKIVWADQRLPTGPTAAAGAETSETSATPVP